MIKKYAYRCSVHIDEVRAYFDNERIFLDNYAEEMLEDGSGEYIEAYLTFDPPEKKVTLTESEITKAANDLLLEHGNVNEFLKKLGFKA